MHPQVGCQRIAETPGLAALDPSTIHVPHKEKSKKSQFNVMIVDEASMIDVNLMVDLLEAIPDDASLVFMTMLINSLRLGLVSHSEILLSPIWFVSQLTGNFRQLVLATL